MNLTANMIVIVNVIVIDCEFVMIIAGEIIQNIYITIDFDARAINYVVINLLCSLAK